MLHTAPTNVKHKVNFSDNIGAILIIFYANQWCKKNYIQVIQFTLPHNLGNVGIWYQHRPIRPGPSSLQHQRLHVCLPVPVNDGWYLLSDGQQMCPPTPWLTFGLTRWGEMMGPRSADAIYRYIPEFSQSNVLENSGSVHCWPHCESDSCHTIS